MSDSPERPEGEANQAPGDQPTAPTPRWVKVAGITALALALLFFILKLVGVGGDHGPGRHSAGDYALAGKGGPPHLVAHAGPRP